MTAPWGRWWHPRFANSVAAQQEYHSIVLRLLLYGLAGLAIKLRCYSGTGTAMIVELDQRAPKVPFRHSRGCCTSRNASGGS